MRSCAGGSGWNFAGKGVPCIIWGFPLFQHGNQVMLMLVLSRVISKYGEKLWSGKVESRSILLTGGVCRASIGG